tara:strand:- start:568 stop:996 length:429 start_codon:yes stop_codon:yes gene_type:complete
MLKRYILILFIATVYSQNYYISPGINLTFNEYKHLSLGFQMSIGASYEIIHTSMGLGGVYSLQNQEFRTYNFIGGGLTFLRFEYGNVKLKISGQSKNGKRTNILFGTSYSNSELFHSFESSTLDNHTKIKRHNWIKFPIIIK